MHRDPTGLLYSGLLLGDGWVMTPAEVRLKALWTSVTHWAVAPASASLSVTKDNWSRSWHFHLEWSSYWWSSVKRCVARIRPNINFLFSAFMSILCCCLLRGHPPTWTLWASHYNTLQWQGSLCLSLSPFSSPLPPFLLSSLFSPWWYPCHVVMATIGPWLRGC